MDSKARYSDGVATQKIAGLMNQELNKKIANGIQRALKYKNEWASVDINTVVARFAPNASPEYINGKIVFNNNETRIAVVADIGGGYLRIQDKSKQTGDPQYLNLDGSDGHNYKDNNGKIHGKSKSEYNRTTHFRIKKREEM